MGLFSTKNKTLSKTVTAKCPVCGKEHTAKVYSTEAYYLDGTKQLTLAESLSKYVECDCGMVFSVVNPYAMPAACEATYNDAKEKTYADATMRMLELIHAQSPSAHKTWMYVRYYQEKGDEANLRQALEEQLNCLTRYGVEMGSGSLPQIGLKSKFIFNEKYERIDLLRRLGRFDDAKAEIQALRQAKYYEEPYELWDFLKLEEKLINKQDTTQH
jgi:hypothetical protein